MSLPPDPDAAARARRRFLHRSGGLAAAAIGLSPLGRLLAAAGTANQPATANAAAGYGPLRVKRDLNTGLPLLHLPNGFSYISFGWAGEALADGSPCPGSHDGMGIVAADGDRLTLIRNHEIEAADGVFAAGPSYDRKASGGCVRMSFDTASAKAGPMQAALTGTIRNCSGGVTPWGSWLSCEEFVSARGKPIRVGAGRASLAHDHGFVFEVPASGQASAEPLLGLGQFRHEAAVVHQRSGAVYMTEDAEPSAGFFRYTPKKPGQLAAGGRLQMLKAEGTPDLRGGLTVGQRWKVSWVDIENAEHGFDAKNGNAQLVQQRGVAAGASMFTRLEGCIAGDDEIFFTATNGGDASCGQVFVYRPDRDELMLVYESGDPDVLDFPDSVVLSPRGGLVICQDSKRERQHLFGLTRDGSLFPFAVQDVVLDGAKGFGGDFRSAEWSGCCFSPDGRWLFANVFSPGFSVAITGPWKDGLI